MLGPQRVAGRSVQASFGVRITRVEGVGDDRRVQSPRPQFAGGHQHTFQIAEFRRPEFEVTAATAEPGPYLAGEQVTLTGTARYFSGGGLPAAPITWTVRAEPGTFTPPNRGDYAFSFTENLIHGSDSPESAAREIPLYF